MEKRIRAGAGYRAACLEAILNPTCGWLRADERQHGY
jgi:hypothetical protein